MTLPILTSYLSPSEFGFYTILVQVVTITQASSLVLFSSALLRFYVDYDGEIRREFLGTVISAFAGLLVLVAMGLYLGRHHWLRLAFPNITMSLDPYVLYAMVWMILISFRGLALTLIKTLEKPLLALQQVVIYGFLIIPLLYWLVVFESRSLLGALVSLVLAELGSLLLLLIRLRGHIVLTWRPLYLKKVFMFSAPLAVSSLLFILFNNMDRIVLSRYVPLAELGTYGIGFIVGNIAALVVTANVSSYSPRMLKVMKMEGDDAAKSLSSFFYERCVCIIGPYSSWLGAF